MIEPEEEQIEEVNEDGLPPVVQPPTGPKP